MTPASPETKLRIPIGKPVFSSIREKRYACVDKTSVIALLENLDSECQVILRPRRFGKSVMLSMLEAYYDKDRAGDFDRLFGNTCIHEHPTPSRGSYYVLHFDFSGIDDDDKTAEHFKNRVRDSLNAFLARYRIEGREAFAQLDYSSPADLLNAFCSTFNPILDNKVFLLIDEYDQFANEIWSADSDKFKSIVSVHGFLKNFYSVIKAYADRVFSRIYLTGVMPISLDSMTSGFSIATNYTQLPRLAAAFGLTESELKKLIHETIDFDACQKTEEEIFQRMKDLYSGYRFSPDADGTVFHTSMCLEYLRFIREYQREPAGSELLDSSVAVDLTKIHGLLAPGRPEFVQSIVERCLRGQAIPIEALSKTINLNQSGQFSDNDVLTALFSMGYLTFASGEETALICPNKTILEQFFGYYFKYLTNLGNVVYSSKELHACEVSLRQGDITPFLKYVEKSLQETLGLHGRASLSETHIQLYLLGAARLLNGFRASSETEALGQGFLDVLIEPTEGSRSPCSFLLELKHLPQKEDTPQALAEKIAAAREPLNRYGDAANLRSIRSLKKFIVVFVGVEIRHIEPA